MEKPIDYDLKIIRQEICLVLTLHNIRLDPRWGTRLPPGAIQGDWQLFIELRPMISLADAESLSDLSKRYKLSLDDPLLNVVADGYCYDINYPSYRPAEEKDLKIVREFVAALSSRCTLIDGDDASAVLKKTILDP